MVSVYFICRGVYVCGVCNLTVNCVFVCVWVLCIMWVIQCLSFRCVCVMYRVLLCVIMILYFIMHTLPRD